MGVRLRNLSIVCDYATPEKQTALELHMALPIPYQDLHQVQTWLDGGEWQAGEDYLISQYPQYRGLIHEWIAASRERSEGASELLQLAA